MKTKENYRGSYNENLIELKKAKSKWFAFIYFKVWSKFNSNELDLNEFVFIQSLIGRVIIDNNNKIPLSALNWCGLSVYKKNKLMAKLIDLQIITKLVRKNIRTGKKDTAITLNFTKLRENVSFVYDKLNATEHKEMIDELLIYEGRFPMTNAPDKTPHKALQINNSAKKILTDNQDTIYQKALNFYTKELSCSEIKDSRKLGIGEYVEIYIRIINYLLRGNTSAVNLIKPKFELLNSFDHLSFAEFMELVNLVALKRIYAIEILRQLELLNYEKIHDYIDSGCLTLFDCLNDCIDQIGHTENYY